MSVYKNAELMIKSFPTVYDIPVIARSVQEVCHIKFAKVSSCTLILEVLQYIPTVLIFSGLPQLDYVLTPRYKATQLCVDRLRERTDAFYDITVAYSDTKDPQTGERIEAPGLPGSYKVNARFKGKTSVEPCPTYVDTR